MPNHVYSEIRLHGVDLEKVKPLILKADGNISFSVLCPLPLHFWPGSVGSQHDEAFPGTHLDAARKTWGTKWDCYGEPDVMQDGIDVVISFQTAWDTPRGWTVALFNTLGCDITAEWLDEGRESSRRETYTTCPKWGPEWKQEILATISADHRRLHKGLWGVEEFEPEAD